MTGIALTDSQQKIFDELTKLSNELEGIMISAVEQSNPRLIEEGIITRLGWLGQTPRMLARAKLLYGWGKDILTTELLTNEKLFNAKQAIIMKWYEGRLATLDALYTKIETQDKGLRVQIMGLQSCLSFEKEQAKIDSFTNRLTP